MQLFQNLVIIGTSHIAKASVSEVEQTIEREKPEVVALELDKGRFFALVNKQKGRIRFRDSRTIGFNGYLFAKIGEFVERKLGGKVGLDPGEDMLSAARIASKNKCKIALIDQKIEITLKNFSKEITWKERFRFVGDILTGFVSKKNKVQIDLNKVPDQEVINKMLLQVKERFPIFYRVLVTDRNKYMAKKLVKLMGSYTKVVAVVGAGHEEELLDEIKLLLNSNTEKVKYNIQDSN